MKNNLLTLIAGLILSLAGCSQKEPLNPTENTTENTTDNATDNASDNEPVNDSAKEIKSIIIDTDMAIDDWPAILYILQSSKAKVLAITVTGAGEAYCAEGMRNAMYLLRLADKQSSDIVVACGDSEPMDGYNVFPQAWRDSVNNLYGLPIPTDLPSASDKHAVAVLFDLIKQSKTPVDIVTLGNLTNIGQMLQQDSSITAKIGTIYIMGGAINAIGNIIVPGFTDNNKNKVAEWNIYVDPEAAQIVFRADVAKALVPLDATNTVRVTKEFALRLKQEAQSASAKFFDQVLDKNDWFIASGEYYFWDMLTAVYALNEDICETEQHYVDVIVKYSSDAETNVQADYSKQIQNGQKRNIMDPYVAGRTVISKQPLGQKMTICLKPDAAKFKTMLIDGLNN